MKRKIIFVVPNLRCGGASKVMSLLCQNVNNNIYDVILLVVNMEEAFYEITNKQVRVVNLAKKHIKNAATDIYRFLKKENPQFVFSNGQDLNILMALLKIRFGKKIKFIARETSVLSGNNQQLKRRRLYSFLIKRFYNGLDKIVCQSKEMYNDLQKNFSVKPTVLTIVPNPVDEPEVVYQEKFSPNSGIKLLSFGRLVPEKGNMRLLEVLSLFKKPFEFIVLGDGSEKEELLKKTITLGIQNNVIFKGTVSDTNSYLADCDIVLLGTFNEGFPNIVLEAGVLGKPVIAYKVPGVDEEVIENEVNGFLIKDGDNNAFLNALHITEKTTFSNTKIINRTLQKYGIKNVMKKYEELFDYLAEK